MTKYLIRFGSNSNWEEIDLDDNGVAVAKRSGYDVVSLDGSEVIQCKEDGDIVTVFKGLAESLIDYANNAPVWWGCRNCDYEAKVNEVPVPDDRLCLDCRDSIYNRTEGGEA